MNLKGGGQLATKSGDGEQMCGMVSRLGSVIGCVFGFVVRWKEDFVSILNRNFARLLMMGIFSRVCSGVLWG